MTRPDRRKHHRDEAPADPGGLTLTELLDTEQGLNSMVERAAAEASAIVSAAREAAESERERADASLAAEIRAVETESASRTAQDVAALAAAARAEAARFDAVPDEQVVALADAVVRDFFGIAPFGTRGGAA